MGGGLTYLGADQVVYQFVFHHERVPAVPAMLYASLLCAPVTALRRLGVDASLERENEIEVRGRRIAGVGAARIGEASVVVGNVLRDFSFRTMAEVWNAPSESFRALAAEALDERVTTLRTMKVNGIACAAPTMASGPLGLECSAHHPLPSCPQAERRSARRARSRARDRACGRVSQRRDRRDQLARFLDPDLGAHRESP